MHHNTWFKKKKVIKGKIETQAEALFEAEAHKYTTKAEEYWSFALLQREHVFQDVIKKDSSF